MAELAAKPRTVTGKKVKTLRKKGEVPAVLYGYKTDVTPISVDARQFGKILKQAGETSLVELHLEGGEKKQVLIHDVSRDTLKGTPTHIDFYAVQMDKPIEATVPLSFIGESEAVKAAGGVLVKVMQEVMIEALPKDLPHEIEVDISSIKSFEDHILVKNLKLPKGVSLVGDVEKTIALVERPRTEEELAALDQASEVSLDAIEVVGEKEKAEAEAEESSTEDKKAE